MCIFITIIANKKYIASTNDPPTRLNVLSDMQTVLIRPPHNIGSGMILSCQKFGRV